MSQVDLDVAEMIIRHYVTYEKFPSQVEVHPDLLQYVSRRKFIFHVYGNCVFLRRDPEEDSTLPNSEYQEVTIPVIALPDEVYEPSMKELENRL